MPFNSSLLPLLHPIINLSMASTILPKLKLLIFFKTRIFRWFASGLEVKSLLTDNIVMQPWKLIQDKPSHTLTDLYAPLCQLIGSRLTCKVTSQPGPATLLADLSSYTWDTLFQTVKITTVTTGQLPPTLIWHQQVVIIASQEVQVDSQLLTIFFLIYMSSVFGLNHFLREHVQ